MVDILLLNNNIIKLLKVWINSLVIVLLLMVICKFVSIVKER